MGSSPQANARAPTPTKAAAALPRSSGSSPTRVNGIGSPYHQDGGSSRMPNRVLCWGCQILGGGQVGLECLQGFFESPAQSAYRGLRAPLHILGLRRVFKQPFERGRQLVRACHQLEPLVVPQDSVGLSEIEGMGSAQDPGAKLYRLDGILAAMEDKRSANKGKWSQPVKQPQLADCVGKVNLGFRADSLPRRAPGDA